MKTIQEMIAVMQHFADGGKVEYSDLDEEWWGSNYSPKWNWDAYDYRIAQPKKKQMKILCWGSHAGRLAWAEEYHDFASAGWKRVPSEDKIIEVLE